MQGVVLTASPEFLAELAAEVQELFPGAEQRRLGAEAIFLVTGDPQRAVRRLLASPPIFAHHLHPAEVVAVADAAAISQAVLARLPEQLESVPAGSRVAVQGRVLSGALPWQPRELKEACDPLLIDYGHQPTIKDPQWVISASLSGQELYLGFSRAEDNLSDWTGGKIHFRKSAQDISRAKFKLMEAIVRFRVRLPVGGRALDLGAAPGGWTSVLLESGLRVVAVDTGLLDPRLQGHPGLEFRQVNANHLRLGRADYFDLITSDISWNPLFTVKIINGLLAHLRSEGQVIMTVKLMGRSPRRTVASVIDALDGSLQVRHAQHLFHNRQEITLHLQKK